MPTFLLVPIAVILWAAAGAAWVGATWLALRLLAQLIVVARSGP